ncbi:hypothetical protein A7G45_00440 [Mycolicibacterium llatzerense]|nr:hypothetical protein [Mycolicibacterium llatzerense]
MKNLVPLLFGVPRLNGKLRPASLMIEGACAASVLVAQIQNNSQQTSASSGVTTATKKYQK